MVAAARIQRRTLSKTDRVLFGRHGMPDARLLVKMALQQPHGGIEIEAYGCSVSFVIKGSGVCPSVPAIA